MAELSSELKALADTLGPNAAVPPPTTDSDRPAWMRLADSLGPPPGPADPNVPAPSPTILDPKQAGKSFWEPTKRALGVAVGIPAAVPAFAWGGFNAPYTGGAEGRKVYSNLPWYSKTAVSLGSGFESAWRAAFTKGDWGTLYGQYYENKNGITIRDAMFKKFVKWNVPDPAMLADQLSMMWEGLMDIGADPLIAAGTAVRQMARKAAIPKNAFVNMPKHLRKTLEEQAEILGKLDDRASKALDELAKEAPMQYGPRQMKPTKKGSTVSKAKDRDWLEWRESMLKQMQLDMNPAPDVAEGLTWYKTLSKKLGVEEPKITFAPKATYPHPIAKPGIEGPWLDQAFEAKRSGVSALEFMRQAFEKLGMVIDPLDGLMVAKGGVNFAKARPRTLDDMYGNVKDLMDGMQKHYTHEQIQLALSRMFGRKVNEWPKWLQQEMAPLLGPSTSPSMMEDFKQAREIARANRGKTIRDITERQRTSINMEIDELINMRDEVQKAQVKLAEPTMVGVGSTVDNFGKVKEIVQGKADSWWVRFEDGQLVKFNNLNDMKLGVSSKMRADRSTSDVTLDMGFGQQLWDHYVDWNKRRRTALFQANLIPDHLLKTVDWQRVIKRRERDKWMGIQLFAPAIKGIERNVIMNIKEIPMKNLRQEVGQYFQNPIRIFERMGQDVVELFYRPVKMAEKAIVVERLDLVKRMKELKKLVPYSSRKKIGLYAHWAQDQGKDRLKAMGFKQSDIPKLTANEMHVYNEMRKMFDDFYQRIQKARILTGNAPFLKVDNYFTFMNDLAEMERQGIHPIQELSKTKAQAWLRPSLTPFQYKRPRKPFKPMQAARKLKEIPEHPLELDAFSIMETYAPRAIEHAVMSPQRAKILELMGTFVDPKTGLNWKMQDSAPNAYKYISDWIDYVSGITPKGGFLQEGFVGARIAQLNRNLTYAILSANVRSALIQVSAIRNSAAYLNPRWVLEGITDHIKAVTNRNMWDEPAKKSNVILGRQYDVAVSEALNAIRGGHIGEAKKQAARVGLWWLQTLDIQTAKITWRAAYKKAKKQFKLAEDKAINYADDVVVRTQASSAKSDLAAVQRTHLGRALTLFQTFVINDWNFLVNDVIGMKSAAMTATNFHRATQYLISTILLSAFYEDVLGTYSPFPTPIKAFREALEEGEDFPSATRKIFGELAEQIPIIGGAVRYGSSPAGAGVQAIEDLLSGGKWKPSVTGTAEAAAKLIGVPGSGQLIRFLKGKARGATTQEAIYGKVPKGRKKSKGLRKLPSSLRKLRTLK